MFLRKTFPLLMIIECSNGKAENCFGEFVITLNDVCYFLHKTNKILRNFEINEFCSKKNQTEVNAPMTNPHHTIVYLFHIAIEDIEIFIKKRCFQFFFCKFIINA